MRTRFGHCLFPLATALLPQVAIAACLLTDYSVKAEYDRSVGVLTGRVTGQQMVAAVGHHLEGIVYTVKIETAYRGSLGEAVEVFSGNSSGRFPMQRDGRYVLFLFQDADRFVVDNCGNSGPVSEKAAVLRDVKTIVRRERSGQNPNFVLHSDAAYGRAGTVSGTTNGGCR